MIAVGGQGTGLSGCLRYIMGEGNDRDTKQRRPAAANENESRVSWIGKQGFGDWVPETREGVEIMRCMMEHAAKPENQNNKTKKCDKDVLHLVLSWRTGENPTRQEMEQAAKEALTAIGMENARAIFVAHNDTKNPHLHIVASRIDPTTGRAFRDSYTKLKWQKWCNDWELRHGLVQCPAREKRSQIQNAIEELNTANVIDLVTQKQSTFTAKELDREIARVFEDKGEAAAFRNKLLQEAGVIPLYDKETGRKLDRFTTEKVRTSELETLEYAERLAASTRHKVSEKAFAAGLAKCPTMTDEQRKAFERATGAEGLTIIDGKAGTGKSYTIDAIKAAYEADGYKVIGLAPTRRIVEKMETEGFTDARTLHKIILQLNNGRGRLNEKTVLIIDEAAMVGTRFYHDLKKHACEAGAKIIGVGDDRQLTSIERGGMFTALREKFGAATLKKVIRQKEQAHIDIAEMLSRGEFVEGVEALDKLKCIFRNVHKSEALDELVEQWKKDSKERPEKSRLVFAYTNDDVIEINARLRAVRKERGELGKEEHEFKTNDGKKSFAKGDRIVFNTSDSRKGINNGTFGTIVEINGTNITLKVDGRENGLIFDAAEVQGFRHGYASTIHKGQGDTQDDVYLFHTRHWKETAAYVALTRHRWTAKIFTSIEVAENNAELARQLGEYEERRASVAFATEGEAYLRRKERLDQLLAVEEAARHEATKTAQQPTPAPVPEWAEERQRLERIERMEQARADREAEARREAAQEERRIAAQLNRAERLAKAVADREEAVTNAAKQEEERRAALMNRAGKLASAAADRKEAEITPPRELVQRAAEQVTGQTPTPEPTPAPKPAYENPWQIIRRQQAEREAAKANNAPEPTQAPRDQIQAAAAEVTGQKAAPSIDPPPHGHGSGEHDPAQQPTKPAPTTPPRAKDGAAHDEDGRKAEEAKAAQQEAADQRDDQQPKVETKADRREREEKIIAREQEQRKAALEGVPVAQPKTAAAPVATPQPKAEATPAPLDDRWARLAKHAAAEAAKAKAEQEAAKVTDRTAPPPVDQKHRREEVGAPQPTPAPQARPETPAPTLAPTVQKPATAPQKQQETTPAPKVEKKADRTAPPPVDQKHRREEVGAQTVAAPEKTQAPTLRPFGSLRPDAPKGKPPPQSEGMTIAKGVASVAVAPATVALNIADSLAGGFCDILAGVDPPTPEQAKAINAAQEAAQEAALEARRAQNLKNWQYEQAQKEAQALANKQENEYSFNRGRQR